MSHALLGAGSQDHGGMLDARGRELFQKVALAWSHCRVRQKLRNRAPEPRPVRLASPVLRHSGPIVVAAGAGFDGSDQSSLFMTRSRGVLHRTRNLGTRANENGRHDVWSERQKFGKHDPRSTVTTKHGYVGAGRASFLSVNPKVSFFWQRVFCNPRRRSSRSCSYAASRNGTR